MAGPSTSTTELIANLTEALNSASSALSSNDDAFQPPLDGISLLDVKNDVLLSYLENLVFLVILRIRDAREERKCPDSLSSDVVRELIKLRVYLERGVRPLEGRLKYQIDKVLRAAADADRASKPQITSGTKRGRNHKNTNGAHGSPDESHSDSDRAGSDAPSEAEDEPIDDLSYRPNPAALMTKSEGPRQNLKPLRTAASNGAYKPPRITPTAMPTAPSSRRPERRRKSHLLDEYVDAELSTAPLAQPSIGSNGTILDRGRGSKSARDRAKEKERIEYEERNLTRLPAQSKAEKKMARQRGEGGGRRDMFGGEDWTGLGGLGDRVARSVGGKLEKSGVLQRREKRRRPVEDGPRGDGVGIGDMFEKRRKILQGRADKKKR